MKRKKKSLKPKLRLAKKLPAAVRARRQEPEAKVAEAIQNLPRITNETVAEHREEVLSSARKYIYPLAHSKHRILVLSVSILVAAVVVFFAYCGLALYKFQNTSAFIYGVSRVIPFPVAKAGPSWVSYESYLFELRHYLHYYQTQQAADYSTPAGKKQLVSSKQLAMQEAVNDAYVKQLASQHHISVSGQEVDDEVALVRTQNRLGSNDQVFRNVLSEFWGWTINDFKRELKSQLLAQKVVSKLDTGTWSRAQSAFNQLNHGANFAKLAKQVSDDATTKAHGGEYGFPIDQSNRDIAPQAAAELFKLKAGHYSDIINTGNALEIDKVLSIRDGGKVTAAHIVFNFKSINDYINPLKAKEKPHQYIKID